MTSEFEEQIQEAAKTLFIGAAPERSDALDELWSGNNLKFTLLSNLVSVRADGQLIEEKFIIRGGTYREVQFNHRAMRAFWVASFAAWEGMSVYLCSLGMRRVEEQNLDRFRDLLYAVHSIIDERDPTIIPLPQGVPNPGQFTQDPETRAPGELAVFAVAWALLHEIRHIKHQREGTSTTYSPAEEQRQEEFFCDEFAVKYLLGNIKTYSDCYNESQLRVTRKRRIGLHFALFALTVLAYELPQKWGESGSHPSIQSRIDKMWDLIQDGEFDLAALYSLASFRSLQLVWPDAPCPNLSIRKIIYGILLHIKRRFT